MKYQIHGNDLPVVIVELEQDESVITQAGGMSWMSPNLQMETNARGGIGKAFGRAFSGESMFQNAYTARGGSGFIAFASSLPGSLIAREIGPGNEVVIQKGAFLASSTGVQTEVFFQKKLGAGLFGGEGFIMQRVFGEGLVFLELDGHVLEYELAAGQQMVLDTGHLVAMDTTCSIETQTVKGVKNVLLGGEGLFNTVVSGPGHIWIQSMPISNVARALTPFLPNTSS